MSSAEDRLDPSIPVRVGAIISDKFRVERVLGIGGMGCVVAAHHLLLDERVALKFLRTDRVDSTDLVERFSREARAIAKLRSEHVTRVLDVGALPDGTPYIVMEYLDGQDLGAFLTADNTLSIPEAVDLVMQALEALAEAHRLGITHRDLKPANLFLSRRHDGTLSLKVLDFGISKIAGSAVDVTATALALGTPSHMPPEQWDSARDADPRSDIWSMGTILFQLVCGREPFVGAGVVQLWHAIATAPTPSMRAVRSTVPAELEAIVARCLEKVPAARYQDVAALAVELAPFGTRRASTLLESIVGESAFRALTSMASAAETAKVGQPSPGAASMQLTVADTQLLMGATGMRRVLSRPAVAVMPFENLSGDSEQAYFADGISEDIITSLSNWRWFPVIGRNSTFTLRGKAVGPAEVGRQVGARYVVDGSVRKAGNRVRVSAQLTDASSGHHLWTQRYDREIQDIFALQDEISYAIVAAIEPQVAQAEEARIARTPIENYDAWDLSVQALSHIRRGTRADLTLARSILQRAIATDPTSSYSRSLLALAHFRDALFGWTSDPARELASTRDAAADAVALDANDWLAHALYAIGLVWVERAFDRAIAEAEKAVSLNPSAPLAYHFLGCALQFDGRAEESIAALKAELQLDPRYQSRSAVIADIALGHLQTGDFALAASVAREAINDSPSNVRAWQRLTVALGMLNATDEARAALERVLQLQPDFSVSYIDATYPFRHMPHRTMFLEGLRRAGWNG